MPGWLLSISRDSEMADMLSRALMRFGGGCQVWSVGDVSRARRRLAGRTRFPSAIVIDELFLRGEPLLAVAEEFAQFGPVVVIAHVRRQAELATLVAARKADFVPRDDNFIPLTLALVERALQCEREASEEDRCAEEAKSPAPSRPKAQEAEASRLIGGILDNLEVALSHRNQLPAGLAHRLGRIADLAFDLKESLRWLSIQPEPEVETERTVRR